MDTFFYHPFFLFFMCPQKIEGEIHCVNDYHACLEFKLNSETFSTPFRIRCPNENDPCVSHEIVKNGHSINTKARKQQYLCKTCKKFFFIHTSKFFREYETGIKAELLKLFADCHFSTKILSPRFRWSKSTANRIIEQTLEKVAINAPKFTLQRGKLHIQILFIDETFLKIGGKTWYLIMAVADTGHILAVDLKEHRDQQYLIELVKKCEAQLDQPLQFLATDGFMAYKGVALALHHNLIHIRHIHKPPYGRVEIDAIECLAKPGDVRVTTIATMNDIFQEGGRFLARVSQREISTLNLPPKRRGRKRGGENRSKKEIDTEKAEKKKNPKKRGRPKKKLDQPVHIFDLKREKSCVQPWGESSQDAANILTQVFHVFHQKCITTNLIEKEFSVLKILICFRGRRSIDHWMRLVHAYCAIRNNPRVLEDILKETSLSGTALQAALSSQLSWGIKA